MGTGKNAEAVHKVPRDAWLGEGRSYGLRRLCRTASLQGSGQNTALEPAAAEQTDLKPLPLPKTTPEPHWNHSAPPNRSATGPRPPPPAPRPPWPRIFLAEPGPVGPRPGPRGPSSRSASAESIWQLAATLTSSGSGRDSFPLAVLETEHTLSQYLREAAAECEDAAEAKRCLGDE